MSNWKEERQEINRWGRLGIAWWVIIVIVALAIGAGIWALTVALSAPRGQGDAIIQKNSAANWTASQARFEDNYQEIIAADKNIAVIAASLTADPENKTLQTNYTGLQTYCNTVTADYNADARKFLSSDFRSADLPQEIDALNPNTDCK